MPTRTKVESCRQKTATSWRRTLVSWSTKPLSGHLDRALTAVGRRPRTEMAFQTESGSAASIIPRTTFPSRLTAV